jgi:hypothetical protein
LEIWLGEEYPVGTRMRGRIKVHGHHHVSPCGTWNQKRLVYSVLGLEYVLPLWICNVGTGSDEYRCMAAESLCTSDVVRMRTMNIPGRRRSKARSPR